MRNRIKTVLTLLVLILFTMACTVPFYIGPAPEAEEKIVYVEITSTPVEEEESSDAETEEESVEEVSATPTVSVNLDGEWTIWYGSDETELSIDFLQIGYDLTGNAATGNGHSIAFKGVVSQEGTEVSGTWEKTSGTSGNFLMQLDDSYSNFNGNMGGGVPLCGTRMNSSKPYPCLK